MPALPACPGDFPELEIRERSGGEAQRLILCDSKLGDVVSLRNVSA
jgi:hypothetical protein